MAAHRRASLAALRRASSSTTRPVLEELKVKLDGTEHRFALELWLWAPSDVVVGKWTAPGANAYGIPAKSTSWGVWPLGTHQSWGAYRIHGPDGVVLKYRFDALENARAIDGEPRCVAFDDLLLDITVASGEVIVEDEDEVEAASVSGALRPEQLRSVRAFQAAFIANPTAFLSEVDAHITAAEELDVDD